MRLLPKERYRQPFCLGYSLDDGRFVLDFVIGSELMSGPKSNIGFLFAGQDMTFGSREEMDLALAVMCVPAAYVGNFRGYYSDCDIVRELVAATNPDSVET